MSRIETKLHFASCLLGCSPAFAINAVSWNFNQCWILLPFNCLLCSKTPVYPSLVFESCKKAYIIQNKACVNPSPFDSLILLVMDGNGFKGYQQRPGKWISKLLRNYPWAGNSLLTYPNYESTADQRYIPAGTMILVTSIRFYTLKWILWIDWLWRSSQTVGSTLSCFLFIQQRLCWLPSRSHFTSSCTITNGWNRIISHAHPIICLEVDIGLCYHPRWRMGISIICHVILMADDM